MRPDHNISCDEHCYREPHLLMYVYCRHLSVSGCVWDGVKQGCNNLMRTILRCSTSQAIINVN